MGERKPYLSMVIEQDLLEKIDKLRIQEIQKQGKVISRSQFVSELIEKGLKK